MTKQLRQLLAVLVMILTGATLSCKEGEEALNLPAQWFMHVPPAPDYAAGPAVTEAAADITKVTGQPVLMVRGPAPVCRAGEVHLVLSGADGEPAAAADLSAQEYTIGENRCSGGGRVVRIRGGSALSEQWAVYDLMRRLGIRYFHPEQTFYPGDLSWPEQPLTVREGPDFMRRSFGAHMVHPIELSAPLNVAGLDMAAYQRRWVNWSLKMRQNIVNGWNEEFLGDYVWRRGFPRGAGINLLETQQGQKPVLDPDDPRPESVQIAAAIDAALAPVPGKPPVSTFGFNFAPTEFSEGDPVKALERINFITNYVSRNYPGVQVWLNNHGTAQEPVEPYGLRFGDLPGLGPEELNVSAHPLMFYDVSRPAAGVYGNKDFHFLRDFMLEQQEKRRVEYFPEASWWLTFDLPVPLYLAPVTLEARQNDVDLLRPYLATTPQAGTGIHGHRLFTSGQEWGYWLIDYCVAGMTWDTSFTWLDCLRDFTGQLEGGEEIFRVLQDVADRQVRDMRDPDILRMLVGSDLESEAGADLGIVFHPLPPLPSAVMTWSDAEVKRFRERSLAPLEDMEKHYQALADRVQALIPLQDERQAPWVREIHDGLQIFAWRAKHSLALYRTLLDLRGGLAGGDNEAVARARLAAQEVSDITAAATTVVRRREQDYRYPPALSTAGDEPGKPGAVTNRTVYPFRVMSRTHRLYYWHRPDQQLKDVIDSIELVSAGDRMILAGESLEIRVLAGKQEDLLVQWGDGTETGSTSHIYTRQGLFTWNLTTRADGQPLSATGEVAVVERQLNFPKGSLKFTSPPGAAFIDGLLAGYRVGTGDDGGGFLVLAGRDAGGDLREGMIRRSLTGADSGPEDLPLSLGGLGALTVYDAVITLQGEATASGAMEIRGYLSSEQCIGLVLAFGGFDPDGAREFIADMFGFTPATLPELVPVVLQARED